MAGRVHSYNVMRTIVLLVMVMVLAVSAGRAQSQPEPVVRIERSGDRWLVWFPHQPEGLWALQANPTGQPGDWFTLPNFFDDGKRVQCIVPDTPMMFFRARRVR